MAETGTDIHKATQLLQQGELVAIPTETVYGLAGNALNAEAVAKIFVVKKRPQFDPLIIHIPSPDKLTMYTQNVPAMAMRLAEKFWPGPLTLVLEKKPMIPDLVTSGLSTVGVRCPNHPLTTSLLRALDFPLAAPSANPFGYVSPTTAAHVNEQLGNDLHYILDGGACRVGIESTIVGFENDVAVIYRIGGLSVEAIESVTGKAIIQPYSTSNPKAPGQLKSHYAPAKKLILGEMLDLLQKYPAHDTGLLTFTTDYNTPYQYILSRKGSLEEAAQNLFAALRSFDKMPVEIILAEPVPDTGIGQAINDRLRRAAAEKD
ncbi:MAG TPA: L-threonylcarbamoyladenylate synthase [Chryseosolibacter sp.]|nr:L-threonylcarbamoyladenylate synthase [Chryseosolibacter sp.]